MQKQVHIGLNLEHSEISLYLPGVALGSQSAGHRKM